MEPYAASDEIWQVALVFARVSAVIMLIPGIGESYVPGPVRLAFALLLSLALTPIVAAGLPLLPATIGGIAGWLIREIATGLMIGSVLRLFMSALGVAGEIVSLQTTLSFSQTTNPMQAQPGTTIATFLTLLGVVLVFSTNLHHLFIAGIAGSYQLISPAGPLIYADGVDLVVRTVSQAFALGVQLSAPVIVFGLIFNLASGLVGRVMPSFQIFFAAAPLNILLGLAVFALSLGVLGSVFIERYRNVASYFVGG